MSASSHLIFWSMKTYLLLCLVLSGLSQIISSNKQLMEFSFRILINIGWRKKWKRWLWSCPWKNHQHSDITRVDIITPALVLAQPTQISKLGDHVCQAHVSSIWRILSLSCLVITLFYKNPPLTLSLLYLLPSSPFFFFLFSIPSPSVLHCHLFCLPFLFLSFFPLLLSHLVQL